MSEEIKFDPIPQLVAELNLPARGITAVIELLAEGNTVPFIARYRKEITGALDEVQIRAIQERHTYLVEFEKRREAVLKSIEEQGKLTDELRKKILECTTKTALEDIYLPYKPKRRTRATIAREKGLQPLADLILAQGRDSEPDSAAAAFISEEKGVADIEAALQGARDIVAEIVSENAEVRAMVRQVYAEDGVLVSEVMPDKKDEPTKFMQYYDFRERVRDIPSHRFLAIRRGERENVLSVHVEVDVDGTVKRIEGMMNLNPSSPWAWQFHTAIDDAYRRLIASSVETDTRVDLKLRSDNDAVEVFANNLRNLLMAAPLGGKPVVGIDPGIRTGCKCVAVDSTGKFLDTITIYISRTEGHAYEQAEIDFLRFIRKHKPIVIAIGNGTHGRETEAFARHVIKAAAIEGMVVLPVNESGASVYSASDIAREEFPDLDLTIRGAISIARRLQDPLAELVKIDPKSIGVGQYQHDVHQPLLSGKLDEVVEDCVNSVGVELNTASAPLLARVAGIGPNLAKKIVEYREANGAFSDRGQLKKVAGLGPRTFEQAAGFIRIRGAKNPLDASAVHPERYELVAQISKDMKVALEDLVGNSKLVDSIDINAYVSDKVGLPTLRDIVEELKKPGRDPRREFELPAFRDDVHSMEDLKAGMELEGVVTNVANFGAFVDIGVHQDGLVHVSELADRFVKDPSEVVKVGDRIKVRVLEVDLVRKRISLSAKKESSGAMPQRRIPGEERTGGLNPNQQQRRDKKNEPRRDEGFSNNPFAKLKR